METSVYTKIDNQIGFKVNVKIWAIKNKIWGLPYNRTNRQDRDQVKEQVKYKIEDQVDEIKNKMWGKYLWFINS